MPTTTRHGWSESTRSRCRVIFGDSVWEQTMPAAARAATRPDTSAYEGDGIHTFFPHRFTTRSATPIGAGR